MPNSKRTYLINYVKSMGMKMIGAILKSSWIIFGHLERVLAEWEGRNCWAESLGGNLVVEQFRSHDMNEF